MIFRLVSGSLTPASAARNVEAASTTCSDAGRRDEIALDLLGFALAQQPVVDEDARQLVTDRALHQRGRDGGIDATRQAADHPAGSDLRTDALDLFGNDPGRRPARLDAGDLAKEAAQHGLAVFGVPHLGMELHARKPTRKILESSDR